MDALKFVEEYERMCKHHDKCKGCRFDEANYDCPDSYDLADLIVEVEQWSKEHPKKTNGQVILDILFNMGATCIDTVKYGYNRKIEISVGADWWEEEYKEEHQREKE